MRNKNEGQSLRKRFPTLMTGLAVLVVTVVLTGGRSLVLKTQTYAATPISRQSVNVQSANLVTGNQNAIQTANISVTATTTATATVQGGVQYVTSTISGWRYEPITVQEGIPVKWTINVPVGSLNGCNNSIVIPTYNLQVKLNIGENVVEFTPTESGTFVFSCWMGMIRSNITVTGEDGTVAANQEDGSNQLPAGCCN